MSNEALIYWVPMGLAIFVIATALGTLLWMIHYEYQMKKETRHVQKTARTRDPDRTT